MKKYILFLLTLFLFIPVRTNALELENNFEEVINIQFQSSDEKIYQTYNNVGKIDGYLICDSYFNNCIKYDLDNNVVWNNNVNANEISIEPLNISNSNTNIMITKYTSENIIEWIQQFGGNNKENIDVIIKNYNNENIHDGYLMLGTTTSTDIKNIVPGEVMVKYDLSGNILWIKNIKTPNKNLLLDSTFTNVSAVNKINNNQLEILGQNNNIINTINTKDVKINDFFFSKDKTDKIDGIIIVGTTGNYYFNSSIYSDNYIIPEINNSKEISSFLIKYTLEGKREWIQEYKAEDSGFYTGIILKTAAGENKGYLAIGGKKEDNISNSLIVAYDLEGNKLWEEIAPNNGAYTKIVESYNKLGKQNGYLLISSIKDQKSVLTKYLYKEYEITTKETTKGKIAIKEKAAVGSKIKLNVTPKDGYIVKKVIIRDEQGRNLKIDDNTFTMPEGNVIVEASFAKVANQYVVTIGYIILGIILLIAISAHIIMKQKENDL